MPQRKITKLSEEMDSLMVEVALFRQDLKDSRSELAARIKRELLCIRWMFAVIFVGTIVIHINLSFPGWLVDFATMFG